jgi:HEAT repeat protein
MILVLISALLFQNPSLDSPSPSEREAAVEEMAVLGNRNAIPVLAEALKKEPRSDIRVQMVAALGRIRDQSGLPVLAETLQSDLDQEVRLQAIGSILRMYIPIEDPGPLRSIFGRVKSVFFVPNPPVVSAGVQVDPVATEALATAMRRDFNVDVRIEAARALGSLRARNQVPALAQALEDPLNREHQNVRLEIVKTLGTIRDPSAGPALEKALRDPNKNIVSEAILALGLVAYAPARGIIENMFRAESDRRIKNRCLESLSLMRDSASTPLFESLLGHNENYYREMAAEGLARLEYDASGFRDRYPQERNQNVRNALAFGLASSGHNEYINDLANALDGRQAYQAEIYLFELGKFDAKVNELHRYLGSANPNVRAGMARVLGSIGDPASAEPLRALTRDPNEKVVAEAVAALRRMSIQ